ncbi:MAG: hypothetical protein GTN71_25335 [Anaerolineae bacterium]|nr:hypothetical protein [Anaerolineae bacterium]
MKVAIIGPTDVPKVASAAGLEAEAYQRCVTEAATELARRGHELVVVPDRGIALWAAEVYRQAGGPKVIGLIPSGGTGIQEEISECQKHRHLCDVVIEDLTWPEQFPRICQLAEIMLCIGLSCGTIGEIVWTKWVGGRPVVVIEPLISGIPPEIRAETDIRLVADLEGFWEILDSVGLQG